MIFRDMTSQHSPELNPMTRAVMVAFGQPNFLPPQGSPERNEYVTDFVTDFEKSFPAQAEARGGEDAVASLVNHFGAGVVRSLVVQGLRESADREAVEDMTVTLGELAGGDQASAWLAGRVLTDLQPTTGYANEDYAFYQEVGGVDLFLGMLARQAVDGLSEASDRAA
jgi:hypothetical protein